MSTPSTVYDYVRAAFAADAWLSANVHLCDDIQSAMSRFASLAAEQERAIAENAITAVLVPEAASRAPAITSNLALTQPVTAAIFINATLAEPLAMTPMGIVNEIANRVFRYRPSALALGQHYLQVDATGIDALYVQAGIVKCGVTWSRLCIQNS